MNSAMTSALRASAYLDVMRFMAEGKKQAEACRLAHVDEATFIRYKRSHPEALEDFQSLMDESNRESLAAILIARGQAIQQLCDEAVKKDLHPLVRIAVLNSMERYLDKLANATRMGTGIDQDALNDVLGGPQLQPGTSRFTVETTKVTMEKRDYAPGQQERAEDIYDLFPPPDTEPGQ